MQSENNTELKEKVVAINRVAKVVKGGRTFRFSAVVVVGDENGHVGVGNGKAAEVPDAIKKAIQDAKKNLVEVPIVGTTVPHEYVGKFGSASVMLKPAEEGTGVIAGGSVRPILELAGYKDIRTKVIGTNNPRNVVYATLAGLKNMRTDCCTNTTAAIRIIAPIVIPNAVSNPVVLNAPFTNISPIIDVTAPGNPAIIPTKINIEIPFPIPFVVICSPNHISNAVPVISDNTTKNPVKNPSPMNIPDDL